MCERKERAESGEMKINSLEKHRDNRECELEVQDLRKGVGDDATEVKDSPDIYT
jgi:hypothetical protein